jgi:hypothetical protein
VVISSFIDKTSVNNTKYTIDYFHTFIAYTHPGLLRSVKKTSTVSLWSAANRMWLAQFVCAPQFFKTRKGLCGHTVLPLMLRYLQLSFVLDEQSHSSHVTEEIGVGVTLRSVLDSILVQDIWMSWLRLVMFLHSASKSNSGIMVSVRSWPRRLLTTQSELSIASLNKPQINK